ncbi:hypothetical protein [Chryseobacterium sp. 2987]|uniref:hypothetical protein n=1 Tax=Chryseobacterium sp. 2987 TaxID=2817767 RepID=UPI0028595EC8|nr:hypothetical protein [Chryseobacterium sp. 2987]MDR6920564.1 hypothetical protein [Chryseobacterium sp. 2987]
MKKGIVYFCCLLMLIISCKKEIQSSENRNKTKTKIYTLPNDEFREKILPKLEHKKDQTQLTILLDSLDKINLSYCDFMKREFEIDDSCYTVARKKYPDPTMQIQFSKLHDETFDIAHEKFLKQINLNKKQTDFISVFYFFNKDVKSFCGMLN